MPNRFGHSMTPMAAMIACLAGATTVAMADPPAGFINHGIMAPVAQPAWNGVVAAHDADGSPLILVKLWGGIEDHITYYLLIDTQTGAAEQIHGRSGGGAWAMFLSPDNKLYDTLGTPGDNVFVEFDVVTRTVNTIATLPKSVHRAVSFTMDDHGVIWSAMDPGAELFSFNPTTREFVNHGPMAERSWRQYPKIACDDRGWVYATITFQEGHILAFNSRTGERRELLEPQRRKPTTSTSIWRATDGRVYAWLDSDKQWYQLHDGVITPVDDPVRDRVIYDNTATAPGQFADGSLYANVDVPNRRAMIYDPGAQEPRQINFEYRDAGKPIYSMIEGPEGIIYGATGIPLRVFRFDPVTGKVNDWGLGTHGGHVNQWARQGDLLYGCIYGNGDLIEYDPSQPFDDSAMPRGKNPRHLHGGGEAQRLYGRPFALLAHPDGEHVLMSGNPYRANVGAGLLIYNVRTKQEQVLKPEDLIADQGIQAMVALPNGDVIVGTTTAAGTGGARVAEEALVYRLYWNDRRIADTWTPAPGADRIVDLLAAEDGLVYGLTPQGVFFVLDPKSGQVLHHETLTQYGGVTGSQASRVMALAPDGGIYVLFHDAIARIQPGTFTHEEVARPGVPITTGITIAGGRLYFASLRFLWSYQLGQ